MDPLAASLANSPVLFPHALDLRRDVVTLVRLSRADYQNASFLDDRIARPGRDLAWHQLARAVGEAGLGETCHFIFHIGHVGSTLLSRLLGKHPALFSLREPQILRTIAQILPLSHSASLMRGIWVGEPWSAHLGDVAALAAIFVVCVAISARVFRWE